MVKIETDAQVPEGDRARARMGDVWALQSEIAALKADMALLRGELEAHKVDVSDPTGPAAKVRFTREFFAAAAVNDAKRAKHFRAWCDEAWREYCAVFTRQPRVSIEDFQKSAEELAPLVPAEAVAAPVTETVA